MGMPTWITSVSPLSGSGNGTVNVKASAHTGRSQRTGTLTFTTSIGSKTATVALTQNAASLFVNVDSTTYTFNLGVSAGATLNITGTSNAPMITFAFDNATTSGWFGYNNTNTSGVALFYVNGSSTPNNTSGTAISGDPGATTQYTWKLVIKCYLATPVATSDRSGKLNITVGSGSSTILKQATIIQKVYAPSISASPTSLTFAVGGETKSTTITANTNWSAS